MAAVVSLRDGNGALVGDLEMKNLGETGLAPSSVTKSLYFRVMLHNFRQFTASTKTRGEVSCSNKRPWRQKGTGRARCGGASSPLWRKGGILFGPRSGGRELDINRKLSKSVWQWVFSDFLERRAVVCIEPQEGFVGWSTAKARKFLETVVGQETMKRNVFTLLVPESAIGESGSDEAAKAFRNLQNVFIESFDRKDIRSLVKSDMILFFKNDESLFEEMVVKHGTN